MDTLVDVLIYGSFADVIVLLERKPDEIHSVAARRNVIVNNNIDVLKMMIHRQVEFTNDDIATAIEFAHDIMVITLLINSDEYADHQQLFIFAASYGRLFIVRAIANRYFINISHNNDEALIAAATHGHDEIVEFLISRNADPNAQNNAALLSASTYGHTKVVPLVLHRNIDIQIIRNVLMNTCCFGFADITDIILQMYPELATETLLNAIYYSNYANVSTCIRHNGDILASESKVYLAMTSVKCKWLRSYIFDNLSAAQEKIIIDVAIGLYTLDLPVLVVLLIIEELFETKHDDIILYPSSVKVWQILRTVKHVKN